jgi:hypothetical protein
MCRFQTLYYDNDYGYVVKCTHCSNIQIGYGNILITFHESAFGHFKYWLKDIEEKRFVPHNSAEAHTKSIMVPTPCEGLNLLFSYTELTDFNRMLDQADTELQSQQMLDLFKTGEGM